MKTVKTLKPYQKIGVNFLTSRKHSLLSDAMGLGKTLQAIHAFEALRAKRVLIVCPASIKEQWKNEILSVNPNRKCAVASGRSFNFNTGDIHVINYDILGSARLDEKYSVGIFDECHYLKSIDAKRTKAVLGKNGLVHRCVYNFLLTGTPVLNRPLELFPILKVLHNKALGKYADYHKFGMHFCAGYHDQFDYNFSGHSNEAELNGILDGFMLRRTEKDVELELPPKRFQFFSVEPSVSQREIIDKVDSYTFKKIRFDMAEHIATLRRELAVKKTLMMIDQISDTVRQVDKLTIFVYHRDVVKLLIASLQEFKPVAIAGDVPLHGRISAVKTFQNDPSCKVLIGQLTAAGQGLDGLQNVCNHVLFLEWSWTPAEIAQAIARLHRLGQTKSVLIQFYVWRGTVEEHQLRTAFDKTQTIRKIIGD